MAEEEHRSHEEPRPNEHRKLTTVEREREWLAKQYSKERDAYWEKDTVSLMEPASFTWVERAFFTGEPHVSARLTPGECERPPRGAGTFSSFGLRAAPGPAGPPPPRLAALITPRR